MKINNIFVIKEINIFLPFFSLSVQHNLIIHPPV